MILPLNELLKQFDTKQDWFIVGCGPSLHDFDFNKLKDKNTIGLNNSVQRFDPTIWILIDRPAINYFVKDKTYPVCSVEGVLKEFQKEGRDNLYYFYPSIFPEQITERNTLYDFGTVAVGAISLCVKLKAKTVYLLGIDGHNLTTSKHFYDDGDKTGRRIIDRKQRFWDTGMWRCREAIDKYISRNKRPKIINLNPRSSITAWKKKERDIVV